MLIIVVVGVLLALQIWSWFGGSVSVRAPGEH